MVEWLWLSISSELVAYKGSEGRGRGDAVSRVGFLGARKGKADGNLGWFGLVSMHNSQGVVGKPL